MYSIRSITDLAVTATELGLNKTMLKIYYPHRNYIFLGDKDHCTQYISLNYFTINIVATEFLAYACIETTFNWNPGKALAV